MPVIDACHPLFKNVILQSADDICYITQRIVQARDLLTASQGLGT